MTAKTSVHYKVSDATLTNLRAAQKAAGTTATAVVENAVADYSLQWRILEKFFGDVTAVKLYLELRRIMESMMLGRRPAVDWDKPIDEWLRKTFDIVMLEQDDPKLAARNFDAMLEKLEGRVSTFREEIAQNY